MLWDWLLKSILKVKVLTAPTDTPIDHCLRLQTVLGHCSYQISRKPSKKVKRSSQSQKEHWPCCTILTAHSSSRHPLQRAILHRAPVSCSGFPRTLYCTDRQPDSAPGKLSLQLHAKFGVIPISVHINFTCFSLPHGLKHNPKKTVCNSHVQHSAHSFWIFAQYTPHNRSQQRAGSHCQVPLMSPDKNLLPAML